MLKQPLSGSNRDSIAHKACNISSSGQLEKKFADPWFGKQAFPTLTKEKFCDLSSNSERKKVAAASSTILSNAENTWFIFLGFL